VTIELPVGVPVDVPVDVPVGRPDTTAGNDDGRVSERATAPLAVGAPPGRRVLIADDNRDAADTLGLVLAHFGHQVEVVYDGQAAWDAWRRGGHDVAVLDLGMPGLRGEVVASEIRRTAGDDAALLIALTGWGQDSDKRRASLAGFDHHLTKPVDPQQLQRLITRPTSALAGPGVVAR
jgi:CheY-like chemotaxis protein